MGGEKKDAKKNEGEVDDEVSQEDLEKALDTALDSMQKAGKTEKVVPSDEEDEYGEEEEEEGEKVPKKKKTAKAAKKSKNEEDPDFQVLAKSLEEEIIEGDEDAQEVIDAVPFIKALMDALEDQMAGMIKAIINVSDKVEGINERLEKAKDINIAEAKLIKSLSENIRKIGEQPLQRKSVLGKGLEVIQKSDDGQEKRTNISRASALEKITELCKADKISLDDAIKLEGRINKGLEVPENFQNLLIS